MAYKYDVFLSYSRLEPYNKWVCEVFLPFFKPFLKESLNLKEIEIFQDTEEIMTGQLWNAKIKHALIHSKIMVCICTPAYFNSDWCKKEFAVMDHKQRTSGYMTDENANGIIVPIRLYDGEHFPDYISDFQMEPFNDFLRVGPGFEHTPLYVDLQGKIQDWIHNVVFAYENAPDWKDDWLQHDFVTEPLKNIDHLKSKPNKKAPSL